MKNWGKSRLAGAVRRGGSFNNNGSDYPVSGRTGNNSASDYNINIGFRVVL